MRNRYVQCLVSQNVRNAILEWCIEQTRAVRPQLCSDGPRHCGSFMFLWCFLTCKARGRQCCALLGKLGFTLPPSLPPMSPWQNWCELILKTNQWFFFLKDVESRNKWGSCSFWLVLWRERLNSLGRGGPRSILFMARCHGASQRYGVGVEWGCSDLTLLLKDSFACLTWLSVHLTAWLPHLAVHLDHLGTC